METIRAFVNEDNTATIVCPSCSKSKNISVASFKDNCHFLKVRCPCENVFSVHLDFRQNYRKSTDLPGIFFCLRPAGIGGGRMKVVDISLGGVAIAVPEKHNLQMGCLLNISFNLDDRRKTLIKKKVAVRSIKGNFIGCKFVDNQLYEKEIGFYLKS